jgi:hypothetical protein
LFSLVAKNQIENQAIAASGNSSEQSCLNPHLSRAARRDLVPAFENTVSVFEALIHGIKKLLLLCAVIFQKYAAPEQHMLTELPYQLLPARAKQWCNS